jgi:hypothetical protein
MTERLLLADPSTDRISTICNWFLSTENHLSVLVQRETSVTVCRRKILCFALMEQHRLKIL